MNTILLQKLSAHSIDQGLLNQAIGFFNAASRCFANVSLSPIQDNSPMTPGVVCAAFSVEMYLKLINLVSTGNLPRGHKLVELFKSLPQVKRDDLTKRFGDPKLPELISNVSDAFVTWRYEHEHESLAINPHFLTQLARACHIEIRKMKPELTVYGEARK